MLGFEEVIKKRGVPEKIYLADVDILNKIHNDKRFRACELVHDYKKFGGSYLGELRYGRDLIRVSFKPKEKKKSIKKREV